MKKLLLGLFALGSISVFAGSALFEWNASSSWKPSIQLHETNGQYSAQLRNWEWQGDAPRNMDVTIKDGRVYLHDDYYTLGCTIFLTPRDGDVTRPLDVKVYEYDFCVSDRIKYLFIKKEN